ncbi:hypothetical protein [Parasphingorhabdus halotolerans]|uniref:Uncharacterized protein n=1 Tax=Parasphingorhabdus halotolerans TaxID=2725558 RepID=A0A6H2DQ45_9SPHN|nr:hypothetical protein [Parasphingorhabdus halotolerans]QJB70510.1 hypothetical protein HF685_15620 [Parasphingorhabdus halotolerans]
MLPTVSPLNRRVGFWSALFSAFFSIAYIIAQLAEWAGILGSAGGPESSSTATGIVLLLTPSLFLGSAFLILMISVHHVAAPARKIFGHIAVAFATAYVVLTGLVYYVQLTFVAPRISAGRIDGIEMFLFTPFDSFLYSVDLMGYNFMSLSTLFAAQIFTGDGLPKLIRFFLFANGLLLPFLALQIYYHPLIWGGSLWAITFPGATICLALFFRRLGITTEA